MFHGCRVCGEKLPDRRWWQLPRHRCPDRLTCRDRFIATHMPCSHRIIVLEGRGVLQVQGPDASSARLPILMKAGDVLTVRGGDSWTLTHT